MQHTGKCWTWIASAVGCLLYLDSGHGEGCARLIVNDGHKIIAYVTLLLVELRVRIPAHQNTSLPVLCLQGCVDPDPDGSAFTFPPGSRSRKGGRGIYKKKLKKVRKPRNNCCFIKILKFGPAPWFFTFQQFFSVFSLTANSSQVFFYKGFKAGSRSGSALKNTAKSGSAKMNADSHSTALLVWLQ